jgi:hypothetical protein
MRSVRTIISSAAILISTSFTWTSASGQEPKEEPARPTKEFAIRDDRP